MADEKGYGCDCSGVTYTIGEAAALAFGNDEKLTLTVKERPSPSGTEPAGKLI